MTRVALLSLALLLSGAAACTSSPLAFDAAGEAGGSPSSPGVWTRGDLIDRFVDLREFERRREPEGAVQILHFTSESDRTFYLRELYYLAGVAAGPVCTAQEVHLVGTPPTMGPGDYLFLEPVGGRYQSSFVTFVSAGGRPRILYRRPDVTEEERMKLRPDDLRATAVQRRAAWWHQLRGSALAEEVHRLRTQLHYQTLARDYAARENLALPPFSPDPQALLAQLAPLPPEQVRAHVVATLYAPCR